MNRFTLNVGALALALAMALPSFAADMPGRYPPPLDIAPAFNWAGLYVGLNAGYGWGAADWNSSLGTGTSSPGGACLAGRSASTCKPALSSTVWKATSMPVG